MNNRYGTKYRQNSKSKSNFLRVEGVSFIPNKKKWIARVKDNCQRVKTLGLYDTEEQAVSAYNKHK